MQMINVLSLCDGMSCGRIALTELKIKVNRYFASEINRHCIKQTQLNFPDTVRLGDIENWRNWEIDWHSISLVLAGTPCTGFSFAGKRLAFDDPQSRLILAFFDILDHVRRHNPGVLFLLENVRMKRGHLNFISKNVGVSPVMINSALVSAQNRRRYYWSNIRAGKADLFGALQTDIPQPKDRGIVLRDILESEVDEKYYISEAALNRLANCHKNYPHFMSVDGKARTQRSRAGNSTDKKHNYRIIQLNPSTESGAAQPYQQNRVYDIDSKSPALMSQMSCGSCAILQRGHGFNKGGVFESKSPALTSSDWKNNNLLATAKGCSTRIRRLTPAECARLQTVPEWYGWNCSDTQQYAMLGNGWTIEVIKHILSYLPKEFFT
jgi:DNA (cytosine-5)-methyltransferase 3A